MGSIASRLLVTCLASKAALWAPAATAGVFDLGVGFAAVEAGDDRTRPAAALHVGVGEFWVGRAYWYGQEYGPVREETTIVSVARQWGLFRSDSLVASFGVTLMDDRTTLDFDEGDDDGSGNAADDSAPDDVREDNLNVGAAFAVAWRLPPKLSGPLFVEAAWDSHVFPAGSAAIFLASGRRQALSLTIGVSL
jgi:hypothetical protein